MLVLIIVSSTKPVLTWSFPGSSKSTSPCKIKRWHSQHLHLVILYMRKYYSKSVQFCMFTFNDFGNSLWFLIDQTWVAMDGGDLREVWAWMFTTKLLVPKYITIPPLTYNIMYMVPVVSKCIILSFPPWGKWQTVNTDLEIQCGQFKKEMEKKTFQRNLFGIKSIRRAYPQWYEVRSLWCICLHLQTGSGEGCWKSLNDLATVLTNTRTDWQGHTPRNTPPPPPPTQS